jgi:hypothetical protein
MLFTRNQVLLAKVETTRGTDITPTGTDAIKCGVVDVTVDGRDLQTMAVQNSIAALQKRLVNKKMTFMISLELKGSGAAGTAPESSPLLQACGLTETVNAGVDVAYTPENTDGDMKSCTIYLFKDGIKWAAVGCMGNMEVTADAGSYLVATFTMVGKFSSVADAANPTPTYDSTDPVQVESYGFSFGSWNDAVARSFGFASGNTVGDRNDINSSDGYRGPFISARDPVWNANIEAVLEATNTFWDDFTNRDTVALDFTHGTTAGNILSFAAPKANYDAPRPADEQSILMYSLSGQLLEDSGEDNFTLTWT